MGTRYEIAAVFMALLAASAKLEAHDVNSRLSIGGMLASAVQCLSVEGAPAGGAGCHAAAPFQPELDFKLTDHDEFYVKMGFAAGDGLNAESPFILSPWAADLEVDVENVNGRNRNHLLTAWYKHNFVLGNDSALRLTVGIIDAADYLDENAYANDEYTQFLNAGLVNGPNVFLPSYDAGTALEWEKGPWSVRAVYMNVGENDDGNQYDFLAAQLGYHVETAFGEGNYRILIDGTSKQFLDVTGTSKEARNAVLLSCDQQFGKVVRGFIRFGWQKDDAAVDYDAIYSGGIDLSGHAWGRADDNIGIGLAHLNGGNLAVASTEVAETYYRWSVNDRLVVTADLQYMRDQYRNAADVDGFIFGLRLAAVY